MDNGAFGILIYLSQVKDYFFLIVSIALVVLVGLLFTPAHLMVTDELSYYFQGLLLMQGPDAATITDYLTGQDISLIEGYYPGGTPLLMGLLHSIHPAVMYWQGLICLLITLWLMTQILKRLNLSALALAPLLCYVPLIYISRTCMSEMPSLVLVSTGLYLYFCRAESKWSYFWVSIIAGLSLSFRETNLILIAPLAFLLSRNYLLSIIGFLLGLSLRFYLYYLFTGEAFYLKSGSGFGIQYFISNIPIYAFVLLALLPLSPYWLIKIKGKNRLYFTLILAGFLFIHLIYGYQAYKYSGYVGGMILNGRFWIPALPFFVVALGYLINDNDWVRNQFFTFIFTGLVSIFFLAGHYYMHQQMMEHKEITDWIDTHTDEEDIIITDMQHTTPMKRYSYPLLSKRKWSDIKSVETNQIPLDGKVKMIIVTSQRTAQQAKRNTVMQGHINRLSQAKDWKLKANPCFASGKCLELYE